MEPPPLQQRELVQVQLDAQGGPERIYAPRQALAVQHVAAQWTVLHGRSGGSEQHYLVELEDETLGYLIRTETGGQARWYRQRINPRAWRRRLAQGELGKNPPPIPAWKKPLC
jgi:hypothetical protein